MSNSGLSYGLNFAKKPPSRTTGQPPPERNLSALLSAKKHTEAAQDLDPSIYDYDGVYDDIHASTKKSSGENAPKGPKYMARLLEAAEVRKRDQLRAKEKMLQKEREAEGEEYADKEKFVTGAYKAQQEEVRRLEEEERKRETAEAERRKKGGGGMRSMYQGLLDREERRHDAAMKAVEKGKSRNIFDQDDEDDEQEKDTEVDAARAVGVNVNEDGQVVDKRELLSAGLNIKAKSKSSGSQQATGGKVNRSESMAILSGGRNMSKQAMRERQSRMLEAQLEAAAKRAADDELVEQEALQRAAKSKKTDGEISGARERYLQRKKEAEAAKAAGVEQ